MRPAGCALKLFGRNARRSHLQREDRERFGATSNNGFARATWRAQELGARLYAEEGRLQPKRSSLRLTKSPF
jgi:hypothetical protein